MSRRPCHLCGGELYAEPVVSLPGMPRAAQFFPTPEECATDAGITLDLCQCARCGLVQLPADPVPYFREVITAASFSPKTRAARLGRMRALVERCHLHGRTVLEVGCGRGGMLDILADAGLVATGMEASAASVIEGRESGKRMIEGYIGEVDTVEGAPFDAFVCLNYLEHLPAPGDIIERIHRLTGEAAVGYVTVPNLEYLLATSSLYEFVADHLSYFTEDTLRFAFERGGFRVLESAIINDDNDVELVVEKRRPLDLAPHRAEVDRVIGELQDLVRSFTGRGRRVAVWGAGHRTLALLALAGLDDLAYIVDSAPFKQGRLSPVLHLDIVAPERLRQDPVDLVLVMVPGHYPDEVYQTLTTMDLGVEIVIVRDNRIERCE